MKSSKRRYYVFLKLFYLSSNKMRWTVRVANRVKEGFIRADETVEQYSGKVN